MSLDGHQLVIGKGEDTKPPAERLCLVMGEAKGQDSVVEETLL